MCHIKSRTEKKESIQYFGNWFSKIDKYFEIFKKMKYKLVEKNIIYLRKNNGFHFVTSEKAE